MQNRLIKPGGILTKHDLRQVAAIIEQATAANTKAAYRKDLAYFWSWASAALKLDIQLNTLTISCVHFSMLRDIAGIGSAAQDAKSEIKSRQALAA